MHYVGGGALSPKVYFERLDGCDRVEGIARLLLRRRRLEPHILIFCPDTDLMRELDEKLWTVHPESFLAHGVATEDREANAEHPILLATEIIRDNQPEVLINAGLEIPTDLSGFATVVDFVDTMDEKLLQTSRERFRTYRQLGMNPQYLGGKGKRPQG